MNKKLHPTMKNFALIGAAGFVAPRHMAAIKAVKGHLVAALDPHDSVGVLDSFDMDCQFFTEFEQFDRHCELLRRRGNPIRYVVVASPNYLHDAHCRFGMRIGADVICEKPLCTHVKNVLALSELEEETGQKINVVLQLRLHPEVSRIRDAMVEEGSRHKVQIDYITPRGRWYQSSWKGSMEKSGGLATNIGIHLFDLLAWLFGPMKNSSVKYSLPDSTAGELELARADVEWRLSTIGAETPKRLFTIDGEEIELSNGFTNAHTKVYQEILAGRGFGPSDVFEGVRIAEEIRRDSQRNHRT